MNGTPPQAAAGWYPDPNGPGQRYWDGAAWTDQTAPAEPPAAPGYGQPNYGQPSYGQPTPYPAYGEAAPANPSNTLSIIGIVCGAIAFVFCPPLFGIAGIVLGAIGLSRKESLGWVAIGVSGAGLVIGMIIGVMLFSALPG